MRTTIGNHLNDIRVSRKISIKNVAEDAGISELELCKIENGDIPYPSPHSIYRLALYYKIQFKELFDLYSAELQPIAFEFYNKTTGHAYVDYIALEGKTEKEGYTRTPLFKHF